MRPSSRARSNDLLRFGQLDERLLRECLWRFPVYDRGGGTRGQRKFPPGHHGELIDVMKAFGLLRPCGKGRFLVPAMFPEGELPPARDIAASWAPAEARGALASLRRAFRADALPGGFFAKWQLEWSLKDVAVAEHFMQEHVAAFASRTATVLKRSEERPTEAPVEEKVVVAMKRRPGAFCEIRVVGWVDFIRSNDRLPESNAAGSTSWGLFREVVASLEDATRVFGAVETRVPVVDPRSGDEIAGRACASTTGGCRRAGAGRARPEGWPLVALPRRAGAAQRRGEARAAPQPAAAGVARQRRAGGAGGAPPGAGRRAAGPFLCAQRRNDSINVPGEAQEIVDLLRKTKTHSPFVEPQPTFETFQSAMMRAAENGVRVVHFMGHGDVHGSLLWVKQGDKKEYEPMDAELVADVLRAQSSEVRACVVNACGTRPLAVALRRAGIGDVVYWDGAVRDDVASRFSQGFYETLKRKPNGYREAFKQGSFAVRELQQSQLQEGKQKPPGTVRLHPWPWSHSVASLAPRPRSPCGSPRARPDGAASSAGVLSQRRGRRDSRG